MVDYLELINKGRMMARELESIKRLERKFKRRKDYLEPEKISSIITSYPRINEEFGEKISDSPFRLDTLLKSKN